MSLNKIRQKPWSYTLYERDGVYILSVLCGGAAMYELNIQLTEQEGSKAATDEEFLNSLYKEISENPNNFSEKSIKL